MANSLPLETLLSNRVRALPGSPIRALLTVRRCRETLDLGGGIPDPELFPSDLLAEVAARVVREPSARCLQYAPTEGLQELRAWIAGRLNQRGCDVSGERIIVTHGSQQALAAVAALLTGPSQPAALEQPGYPGAQQAFALAEAEVLALPVTREGWDLQVLGRGPSAIYVIPNYQNPTGRRATLGACRELAKYAQRTGTFLIEDDAYGELAFDGAPTRPLLAEAPERTILLGSLSKILCPGLRVGWLAAPRELVEPLVRVLQAASLQPGTLAQHLAFRVLEQLDLASHLARLVGAYRQRALALHARCHSLGFPGELPSGGFFLWVKTPGEARSLAQRASVEQLLAVPEAAFRHPLHPGPDRHLRLAFTRYSDSAKACARLARGLASRHAA